MKILNWLTLAIVAAAVLLLPNPAYCDSNRLVYAVTTSNDLIRFRSDTPETLQASTAITGLGGGESVAGIDFRPATGELFALANNGGAQHLYTINTQTGAATQVGSTTFSIAGSKFGIDFNPTTTIDRIRVVSNAEANLRLQPVTGTVAGTDTALSFAAGDLHFGEIPGVEAVAYTNNTSGVASAALLGIDSTLGILVRQGSTTTSPNAGTLNTQGSLGIGTGFSNVGFDIAPGTAKGTALALFSAVLDGETSSKLYSIDTVSGNATLIGTIGGGSQIVDFSIALTDTIAPQTLASAASSAAYKRLRSRGLSTNISCSEASTISAVLTLSQSLSRKLRLSTSGQATIASNNASLDDSGKTALTLTITDAAKHAFNSKKGKTVKSFSTTLSATCTDAAGNSSSDTLSIKVSK